MWSAIEDPDVLTSWPLLSSRFKIRASKCCFMHRSNRLDVSRISLHRRVVIQRNNLCVDDNIYTCIYIYIYTYISKVGDLSQGCPKGSLFNSYYTGVYGRVLLHSQNCSSLPSILTLSC